MQLWDEKKNATISKILKSCSKENNPQKMTQTYKSCLERIQNTEILRHSRFVKLSHS